MQFLGIRGSALAAIAAVFVLGSSITTPAQDAAVADLRLAAKGVWDAGTTYAKDDIVTARGSSWISLRNNNLNKMPGQTAPSTAAYWRLFARGFNPTGAWSNATTYQPDDLVTLSGQTYRAKVTNTNKQTNNTTYWELFAAKGAAGPNTVADGTVSAPSIKFTGDSNTGIYSPGADKIALVEGGALFLHNIGTNNTALGLSALAANIDGGANTALGASALASNTGGDNNTALGFSALGSNTTGNANTAVGKAALASNTTGGLNTAVGLNALAANTTGTLNVAAGYQALNANTTGSQNSAFGNSALGANTTAGGNSAFGYNALAVNTTGGNNTALGNGALTAHLTGNGNTAVGTIALEGSTTAVGNTAVGEGALSTLTTGGSNVGIGFLAGAGPTNPANSIFIANGGASGDTNTIKIGAEGTQQTAFIAGIRGKTTGAADAVAVLIDSNGQLGTVSSSRRYKYDIETMADVSAMLGKLRPVTFRYKQAQNDGSHPLQYGLIAEEVAEVFPDLAVFKDGQPETVKYHELPTFLLAGYQAQQKTIATLTDQARQQKDVNAAQAEKIETLEARLRQLEALLPQTKAAALH